MWTSIMFQRLFRWFRGSRQARRASAPRPAVRPALEGLEGREGPAAVTANFSNHVLSIVGTAGNDKIAAFNDGGTIHVWAGTRGTSSYQYEVGHGYTGVNRISVNTGSGLDEVHLNITGWNGRTVQQISQPA